MTDSDAPAYPAPAGMSHGEALEELIVTGHETGEWGADQAQAVLSEAAKVSHAGDLHVIGRFAVTFDPRSRTFTIGGFTPHPDDAECRSPYAHGNCGARHNVYHGWYWLPGAKDDVGHEHQTLGDLLTGLPPVDPGAMVRKPEADPGHNGDTRTGDSEMTAKDSTANYATPVSTLHTGDETCRLRPLHDPCHTGCSEDGRADMAEIATDLMNGWRSYLARQAAGPGPDSIICIVHGDSMNDMKASALREARRLYGEDAPLQIERIGPSHSNLTSRGAFWCEIRVRCTTLPEGFLP